MYRNGSSSEGNNSQVSQVPDQVSELPPPPVPPRRPATSHQQNQQQDSNLMDFLVPPPPGSEKNSIGSNTSFYKEFNRIYQGELLLNSKITISISGDTKLDRERFRVAEHGVLREVSEDTTNTIKRLCQDENLNKGLIHFKLSYTFTSTPCIGREKRETMYCPKANLIVHSEDERVKQEIENSIKQKIESLVNSSLESKPQHSSPAFITITDLASLLYEYRDKIEILMPSFPDKDKLFNQNSLTESEYLDKFKQYCNTAVENEMGVEDGKAIDFKVFKENTSPKPELEKPLKDGRVKNRHRLRNFLFPSKGETGKSLSTSKDPVTLAEGYFTPADALDKDADCNSVSSGPDTEPYKKTVTESEVNQFLDEHLYDKFMRKQLTQQSKSKSVLPKIEEVINPSTADVSQQSVSGQNTVAKLKQIVNAHLHGEFEELAEAEQRKSESVANNERKQSETAAVFLGKFASSFYPSGSVDSSLRDVEEISENSKGLIAALD